MLHTPNYNVRPREFCGPTAIAAVTGEPMSRVREALNVVRGRKKSNGHAWPIMGVTNEELVAAIIYLDWYVVELVQTENTNNSRRDAFTLDQFFSTRGRNDGPYIVEVRRHYIAVSHGEACDTHTTLPLSIDRWKRGRRRWVHRWWKFARIYDHWKGGK